MSSDYDEERSEEASSITGQNICVKGFNISESEWDEKETFKEISKDDVRQIGWMNVQAGDIVTLLDSDWDNATVEPEEIESNPEPADVDLLTSKPYRVVGFEMADSEEPFVFIIFLQGPDELNMVVFGGNSSDQDSGVWKAESGTQISEKSVGCGILSDASIATLFGYEPDIISYKL